MGKNIFFTKFSDITGDRIDPLYHVGMENIKANVVSKAKYECESLKQVCSINRGRFGHRPRNDPRLYGGKYPFIQTGDIVNASINNSQIKYTQTLNELGLKTSKLFQPPKLLFTIAANIGDSAILDFESCFPDSVVAIVPKNDNLIIEYLNIYFKIIKPFVVDLAPYSAQKNINNQQLSEIPIITPPLQVQKQIIATMDSAYKQKIKKEQEAKEKLASIDKYLLSELGIEFQEKEKETLEQRVFTRKFSDLSGDRFDSDWQLDMKYSISGGKFENKALIEIANISKGQSITSNQITKGSYPVVAGGKVSPYCHNLYNQNENVITVSASGAYSGYVWFHNYKIFASDCSVIRSKNEKNIMTLYIFEILKLKQEEIYNLQQGAGQPHVYPKDLAKLLLPLPPLNIQNKIVTHIQTLRDEAKILEKEAKEVYENAKKEVEAIILQSDENEERSSYPKS